MDNNFLNSIENAMNELLGEESEKKTRRKQQIPIKKAKFLTAIGKNTDPDIEEDTDEDNESIMHKIRYTTNMSWQDSEVTNKFNTWKEPEFDLLSYIDCAKYVYLSYYGCISFDTKVIIKAMTYLMAHARDFADPTQRLLKFNVQVGIEVDSFTLPHIATYLPDTSYATAINKCLTQLRSEPHTDEVYLQLNSNITYLILLMLRRVVKSEKEFLNSLMKEETQNNYLKLCPHSIHSQLPVISEELNKELRTMLKQSNLIYMVLMALLQCNNEKTKRILHVTCLRQLEWTGLVFPRLFFQVAKLYNVSEAKFWDLLCTDDTFDSLSELSDIYYKQYKNMKTDPSISYKLFPYGRSVNIDFDTDLSPRSHVNICYTLAYLHDLHFGLDKSFAREGRWAKAINPRSPEDGLAMEIYKKLKK